MTRTIRYSPGSTLGLGFIYPMAVVNMLSIILHVPLILIVHVPHIIRPCQSANIVLSGGRWEQDAVCCRIVNSIRPCLNEPQASSTTFVIYDAREQA